MLSQAVGKMRHRFTVQQRTPVRALDGGYSLSWSTLITPKGSIESLRDISQRGQRAADGKEYQYAGATTSDTAFIIKTRAFASVNITPKMRIVFGTRVFNIVSSVVGLQIQDERYIYVEETTGVVAEGSTVSANEYAFKNGWISGLATNNNLQDVPSGKIFFPKRFSIDVKGDADGTLATPLIVNVGTSADHTKYLDGASFGLIGAALTAQDQNLFDEDTGTNTGVYMEIVTPATLATGAILNVALILWGDLVG